MNGAFVDEPKSDSPETEIKQDDDGHISQIEDMTENTNKCEDTGNTKKCITVQDSVECKTYSETEETSQKQKDEIKFLDKITDFMSISENITVTPSRPVTFNTIQVRAPTIYMVEVFNKVRMLHF